MIDDLPAARFLFHKDGGDLITEVRGLMLPHTSLPDDIQDHTQFLSKRPSDKPPAKLLGIHKFLAAIDEKDSAPWTPEYIEVMLYPWGTHAPETGVDWPEGWPDLRSRAQLKGHDLANHDVFYSLFLDAKLLPEVRKLLAKKVDAVKLAGKKWMFSYRSVFPSEPIWRKPFNQPDIERETAANARLLMQQGNCFSSHWRSGGEGPQRVRHGSKRHNLHSVEHRQ